MEAELSPERKLANLKNNYELWDPQDVPEEWFIEIYIEAARKLFAERDSKDSSDFS